MIVLIWALVYRFKVQGGLWYNLLQAYRRFLCRVMNMKTEHRKYKVAALFSGCGGMDLGFRGGFTFLGNTYDALPFEIVWANDLNEAACRTYRRNLSEHIICGDIWEHVESIPEDIDVLIGGFPCQDISINGKGAGVDGKRSGLYRAMVRAVERTRPALFVAENVKGLLMKHNKDSFDRVIQDFSALGYDISFKLYHAADYGVPQMRERVFIVGTKPGIGTFQHPEPVRSKDKHITAQDALQDLEDLPEDAAFSHIWSRANKSPDQGSRILKADKPGQTIRAECHGNIQFHYKLPRRISMREAARIQSFPDSFIFDAKLRETERMLGNAVPPVLAWNLANAVRLHLELSDGMKK